MFTNREEFLQYIITSNLKFNKYDYRFLNNLSLLVVKNKHVTTNQNNLFEKLVTKYKKQLKYAGMLTDSILKLDWTVDIVESTSEFTEAFLSLKNNRLELKLPFSKKFIDEFHDAENHSYKFQYKEKLIWSRTDKCYYGEFNTYNLRLVNEIVPKFFKLNYCSVLNKLINQLKDYSAKYFNPTYVKSNNNFYVMACNNSLHHAIKHINFDSDPKTLLELSTYGIHIDNSVTNEDDFLIFAGERQIVFDVINVEKLVDYLQRLGIVTLVMSSRLIKNPMYTEALNILTGNFKVQYYKYFASEIQNCVGPMVFIMGFSTSNLDNTKLQAQKTITLVNSTAIKL